MISKLSTTTLDSIEEWITSKRISGSTEVSYRFLITKYLLWVDELKIHPKKVTVTLFRNWVDHLQISSNYRYQLATSARQYSVWMFGPAHPLQKLRVYREDPGPQRTLNQNKVDKLISSLGNSTADVRNRALISLMIDTGLRSSEVCDLRLENVDLDNQNLRARCKGNRWLTKVFSLRTKDYLLQWLNVRAVLQQKCTNVFISINKGKKLNSDGLRTTFRRIGFQAGIGLISPHDMRRTMATLAIRNGAPTRLVALQGGWSDLKLVERYTQALTPEDFANYFPMNNTQRSS